MNYTLKIKAAQEKQKALMATAKAADRALTAEEQTSFNALQNEIEGLVATADAEKKLSATDKIVTDPANAAAGDRIEVVDTTKNAWKANQFGEFLATAILNPNDNRLQHVNNPKNTMTAGTGTAGGILIPETISTAIRMVPSPAAQVRPRADIIPAGTSPDGEATFPSLDQTGTKGVYGGVTITKGAEAFSRSATQPAFKWVTLKTNEMGAYIPITNKLLRNVAAMGAFCEDRLRDAIMKTEEYDFLRGSGVGEALGVIGCPASISISRNTAASVKYVDVIAMFARILMDGGSYVWMGSQTILPQLMAMVDPNNTHVWQPNARDGQPSTLLGLPILFNTHLPVLGTEGDLMLVDWKKYAIKDGQEMTLMVNPYLGSRTATTDIQINYSVDGQPWLTGPVMLEDGVTKTSPFVILA